MTRFVSNTTLPLVILGFEEGLVVSQTGAILADGDVGLYALDGHAITIAGLVWASDVAIFAVYADAQPKGSTLRVTQSGQVLAEGTALRLAGAVTSLESSGLISGRIGLEIDSWVYDANASVIRNRGEISGSQTGIWLNDYALTRTDVVIENSGLIAGAAAILAEGDGFRVQLFNDGRIEGTVALGALDDVLVDRGVILGPVFLADGSDLADLSQSRSARIGVNLGAGDDMAILGAMRETISGEEGFDVVSYEDSALGVTLVLAAPGQNRGDALGDRFSGIELWRGSRSGDDRMTGDGLDNILQGLGGADRLAGGAGQDSLAGGEGADTLTGGLGADHFVFYELLDAGDTITDFSRASGDKIALSGPGFGLGVIDATTFRSRADGLAQDASDRLIFQTTTKTLWYDADGSGEIAPVALLQLANASVLAAVDFLLV